MKKRIASFFNQFIWKSEPTYEARERIKDEAVGSLIGILTLIAVIGRVALWL